MDVDKDQRQVVYLHINCSEVKVYFRLCHESSRASDFYMKIEVSV